MPKSKVRAWNLRVRRVLVVALVAPFFTAITVVSPQTAFAAPVSAPGGSCTQDVGNITGITVTRVGNDCVITFTSRTATTWRAPTGISNVRYLVVGGGASGDRGTCGVYWGRGGGGGQVRDSTLSVVTGTNYSVVVGKGGNGATASCPNVGGNSGVASQFANITASPGLGGQINTAKGGVSGSGLIGGVGSGATLGAGGGGGAGVAGSGKNGGAGVNSNISGTTIMYGSGGAGRDSNGTGTASSGGATGNAAATANRGGGGADYGSGWYAGADGVVIIRYTDYVPMVFPQVAYNPTTLSIGAGVGGRSDTFTATNGFGTRTFSLSPGRSGISIDTSTANGVALVVSPLVASGTYLETLTVTDAAGFAVNHVVTVTVANSVRFDTLTATSLVTTYGRPTSLQLRTTGGVGTRVFTMTAQSNPGISLDTSTAGSGFATLNIGSTSKAGTYTVSFSVTDSTKIRSTLTVVVTVNPLPNITYPTGTVPSLRTSNLLIHYDIRNALSYSGSGTTVTSLVGNSNATITSTAAYSTLFDGHLNVTGGNYIGTNTCLAGIATGAYSNFLWINPRANGIVLTENNGGWHTSTIEVNGATLRFRVYNGAILSYTMPALNRWYYVGLVYDGTQQFAYVNGVQVGSSAMTRSTSTVNCLGIGRSDGTNLGIATSGEFLFGALHSYGAALSATDVLNNFDATQKSYLISTPKSGSFSIETTQGLNTTYSTFTATDGTRIKTFGITPTVTGITIETGTANSAVLRIGPTAAATSTTVAATYLETLTATDEVGAVTKYDLTIKINPPIIIAASVPLTLTTTFGRIAYDTFTATQGTGTKIFTGISSSNQSAFVVTNPSANVGLLTVAANLPVGTYLETITATDAVGATTNYLLTVIVNPALALAGATGNTLTTTLARAATLRINVLGGTGARTITWTSPHAGITIESSTITAQNFITLSVSAAVPVRTYSFAITAVDSTSARVSDTFTVVVNRWPVIGTPSIVSGPLRISLDAGDPASYSGSGTRWTDLSGNGRNGTWQLTPTYNQASGGSIAMGSSSGQYMLSSGLGATNVLTAEVWVKFNVIPGNDNCIISDRYTTSFINYSICFRNDGKIYGGYWNGTNGWVITAGTATPLINTWYHFAYTVSLSGSTYTSILYQNGVAVGSPVTSTISPNSSNLGFLVGTNWRADAKVVNGDIAIVRIYGRALTAAEVVQNYNAQGLRFTATNSGTDSATVTQGVAGSITSVTAAEGTGTKTFALSGAVTGISLSNPVTNAFSLALPDTLTAVSATTARTITETVTATDQAGATTSRVYSVVVNPPVIETATSTSIATTSGVETTTVIYATQGTGNKTFTLTGATSGFTLTSGVNQATLRVLSTANPGTYNLAVIATDSLGANTSLSITVVVSPPPTLLGVSRIELTQGVGFTSPIYSLSGGTGLLSMSITNSPINSNITLTGVTSVGGYLQVGSSSATGTFLSTIRVTDARGSFSELVVTVVVNAPVTLSGSLSLTKTYGTSVSSGYSTNGTGTAPFSFSATPICAVVKTVSGSFTYERINGTDSCTWTAPVGVSAIEALIVGAGGGGGADGGAGGGGGSINTLSSVTLPANRQVTVQVGSGGAGGVWGGDAGVAGGTTSITSGTTSYTAPGGSAGGGCGSAAALGGSLGSGGNATVGGNSGFGGTGTGCGGGNGSVGSNGPVSNFTGGNVSYGGGGGGGVYPGVPTTVGLNAGGDGGGGTGAASRDFPSLGLIQYFRNKPVGATNGDVFTTGTCADPITGNINYRTDSYFPCSSKDNFQGYATGYFIAPVSGSIKFFLTSDDASRLTININGINNDLTLTPCCKTVEANWSGFVAGQAYPINVYFTEDAGGAYWILEYEPTGLPRSVIPITQLRSNSEGLAIYFKTTDRKNASEKSTFTTSSLTCMERVGNIAYALKSQFPCPENTTYMGYATGFFIAPVSGDITFYISSDDSSYLSINVNGVSNELSRPCCGEASATWSGFVKGQYYPINVYFTEDGGGAYWKLEYAYAGQSKTLVPSSNLRSTASFTAPVQGTNGLGGGGGGGTAGIFKLSGAKGGSGTAILKYLTQSETATQTMITAIVNQQDPSGLLTLNVPEFVNVGIYTKTIKVQDAANSAPYQAVVTITINKATPTLTLALPGSVTTAKYGNPVTISAVATTPGTVAFVNGSSNITACTAVATIAGLATCSFTPTVIGATTLRATLTPTDTANFNSSAQESLTITVAKADTLTVTVASQTLTYTGSAAAVTRAFTTIGLVEIDSITAISMLYSGTANNGTLRSATTAPTDAGIYTIAPNFPASASAYTFGVGSAGTTSAISNYESVTVVAGTLTINRAPQVLTFTYPDSNTATYSPTGTITASATTRLDSAARLFSSTSLAKCTIDSSTAVISILEAGSCQVTMAVAQTFNYLADTATATVTINKASRVFTLVPATSTLKYAETTTVTATVSVGVLDGTISYTMGSPTGCTFDSLSGELLATSGTIQCPLTAIISESTNYLAETSTAMVLTIAPALAPVITIDTITAMDHVPGIRALITPTYTVAGLKNLDTADSISFTYSFISNPFETFTYSDTRTPIDAGTYRITPSALTLSVGLMSNYETPTYSSSAINFIINRIAQETITIENTNGEVDVPFVMTATGGNTDGALTFTKVDGAFCTVFSNQLSTSQAGVCLVTVTMAGDRNYLPVTSDTVTVRVRNFVFVVVQVPSNPVTGISITPTVPLIKGPDVCTSGCVPTLVSADVYDRAAGELIILTGTNLLTVTMVYFNIYTEAPNFTANSDTELAVIVPGDLPQGDATIEVVSPGGTSNRLFDFIILP